MDESTGTYKMYLDHTSPEFPMGVNFFDEQNTEIILIEKNSNMFPFRNLSSGEKEVLLLVIEIVRRAIISAHNSDIETVRNTPGIILIDEIEQHLHPKWQRNIIPALTKVFPKIQWFVTTHSPQVLSNLKRENIHLIEDFKVVKDVPPTFGEDTNSILWNVFGVGKRPLHAEKAFSKFYRMLEDDKDKSLEILKELEQTYGAEHSDVKKAKMEFELEFGN